MKKVSIDMADWYGVPFRRRLCSAERFSDAATARGLFFSKTPGARSSASLVSVTRCDHRVGAPFFFGGGFGALAEARLRAPLAVREGPFLVGGALFAMRAIWAREGGLTETGQ
jgi:hypothetical protein